MVDGIRGAGGFKGNDERGRKDVSQDLRILWLRNELCKVLTTG